MKNKTDRELLELLLTKVETMESRMETMDSKMETMGKDIKGLKKGQITIIDHITQLDTKNANRHIFINTKVDNISRDIEFIKYKEFKNEEDIFHIRKNKEAIK